MLGPHSFPKLFYSSMKYRKIFQRGERFEWGFTKNNFKKLSQQNIYEKKPLSQLSPLQNVLTALERK